MFDGRNRMKEFCTKKSISPSTVLRQTVLPMQIRYTYDRVEPA